ncbi:MAG: hypothetical protein ACK5QI_03125, partial [Alphaproteobacteria bacterium]
VIILDGEKGMNWREKFKKTLAEEKVSPSPYMLKYVTERGQISGSSGAFEVKFDLTDASSSVKEEILTNFPEAAKTADFSQLSPDPKTLPPVVLDQNELEERDIKTRKYLRLQLSDAEKEKFLKFWKDYNINHAEDILKKNGVPTSDRAK